MHELSEIAKDALNELRAGHEKLVAQLEPIDLPEPALSLDLEERAGDVARIVRHLHQMCTLHSMHFTMAGRFKMPYLTAMYLWASETDNPYGLHTATRALVEFSAFTYEVRRKLRAVADRLDEDWQGRGEAYFDAIVRARFGTGDRDLREQMRADVQQLPKPIHVNDGLRSLAKEAEFSEVLVDYDRLSDTVHHNARSQASVADGYHMAKSASGGRGVFIWPETSPVVRYQYPLSIRMRDEIQWTAPIALRHTRGVVQWLNETPESPYRSDELRRLTGSDLGFNVQQEPIADTPRNAPCPCGSGKKFKRCHGGV